MGETTLDLAFHAIEAGAVVLGILWHVVRWEVKIAVLESKVDMLLKHTGLGQHWSRD